MTEQPYPPLRPQPPVRRRTRPNPWPMIAGVAVLGVLAIALLAILLTRDPGGTAGGSASPSPSASATGSAAATDSAAPSASAGATGSPAAPAPELAHDTIAQTAVEGLTVRADPGLGGERLGTLELGTPAFVVDGPTEADGLPWYLVSALGLPANSGCAGDFETDPFNCPIWFGWVAGADEEGMAWLAPRNVDDCPDEPLTAENLGVGLTAIQRLACFGSEPITFRGWWPEIPDDAGLGGACTAEAEPTGWLLCQNINYNLLLADESDDWSGPGVRVSIDPASGVEMPERGTWVEVRAHLDDPAAQQCDDDAVGLTGEDQTPEQIVLRCRVELVLESAQAVDGP